MCSDAHSITLIDFFHIWRRKKWWSSPHILNLRDISKSQVWLEWYMEHCFDVCEQPTHGSTFTNTLPCVISCVNLYMCICKNNNMCIYKFKLPSTNLRWSQISKLFCAEMIRLFIVLHSTITTPEKKMFNYMFNFRIRVLISSAETVYTIHRDSIPYMSKKTFHTMLLWLCTKVHGLCYCPQTRPTVFDTITVN